MLKSFRFLFQFAWINLACLLGFAVLVVVGCYATGVPGGASNLFATYYGAFPLVTLFVLFLFAFSLCTSNLNLGLSFGARRRDFFWAVQGVLVVYTGFCWAAQVLLAALPQLGGWIEEGRWTLDSGLLRRDAVGVPSSMFDHIGAGLSGRAGVRQVQGLGRRHPLRVRHRPAHRLPPPGPHGRSGRLVLSDGQRLEWYVGQPARHSDHRNVSDAGHW